MRTLVFEPRPDECGTLSNRRVRSARFQARSALPLSAACVVANGIRETLSSLLGATVVMRLFEPSIPSAGGWSVILHDARLYRIRGNVADAAIVLRPADAIAFAATLFGESNLTQQGQRSLSPIECDVLDAMVDTLAVNLGTVCGARDLHRPQRVPGIEGFVSYFELLVVEPVGARIGVALSRDPSPDLGAAFEITQLAAVTLVLVAAMDVGEIEVASVAAIEVGDVVPIAVGALRRCTLSAHGRRIARGTCGVYNGRYAFSVDSARD